MVHIITESACILVYNNYYAYMWDCTQSRHKILLKSVFVVEFSNVVVVINVNE